MRNFPRNHRFKYLIFLHYCGLINLPNYHRAKLTNWLHQYIYRTIVYVICFVGMSHQIVSAFVLARHHLTEFMQRSLECLYVLTFFSEAFLFNLRLQSFLELLQLMDEVFDEDKDEIYKKHDREETLYLKLILLFSMGTYIAILLEAALPISEKMSDMMAQVYHFKFPHRTLPSPVGNLWFDPSEMKFYPVAFVIEVYIIFLLLVSIVQLTLIETVFSTPVLGQYERFSKYVALIGREQIGEEGDVIYYTDIKKGLYVREVLPQNGDRAPRTPHNSRYDKNLLEQYQKTSCIKKCEDNHGRILFIKKDRYEEFFVHQLLIRHQQLNNFVSQYKTTVRSCINIIVIPSVLMVPLSTYQLSLITHMPIITSVKIIFEFVFLVYALWHLVYESEKFDKCSYCVVKAIQESGWYRTSPGVKRKVSLMLRTAMQSNILTLTGRTIVLEYPFMVRVARAAFSFVNFMHLVGNFDRS